jgi:hypothetical protein
MTEFVEVSPEAFDGHIATHLPNVRTELRPHSEPPLRHYYDITKRPDQPDALLGVVWLFELYPDTGPTGQPKGPNRYMVPAKAIADTSAPPGDRESHEKQPQSPRRDRR